jgi:hypothetical protein
LRVGLQDSRRALSIWLALAWPLMLICYFWMAAPGTPLTSPQQPVNINNVDGFSDAAPQAWMPGWAWLLAVMVAMPVVLWWPAHGAQPLVAARHPRR